MTFRILGAAAAALVVTGQAAFAQAFDPGPQGTVVGSSMSGARIGAVPRIPPGPRIPNAHVFGDTVEERTYGRDYDNSYLTPKIPGAAPRRQPTTEELATEGRSDLNSVNAGTFATQGPGAIGGSSVTRPSSNGRAKIVFTRKPQQ